MTDFTAPFRRLAPTVDVAPIQTDDQTFRFVFSNEKVGRDRFIVLNRGIQHANYDRNPVILWAHDDKQPPIGRGTAIDTSASDCSIDVTFVDRSILPFAGTIRDLVAGKWLRAVSLSWLPLKWEDSSNPEVRAVFTKVDMLEVSLTPLPALPGALLAARSHGVDTRPIYEWAEQLLDTGGLAMVSRSDLETLRRAAKMPRVTRASESTEWKVGASRDLEIQDDDSWDGSAAEASIFEYAGGDDFSPAKARKGFLVYDAANPEKRESYKLPIAHVVDGELKVPKGAIRAAASRLPDTDIPADVRDRAGKVLDHYKEKAGIGEPDDKEKRAMARALRMQRGLPDVAAAAWLLTQYGWLHESAVQEATQEGDGSSVPDMMLEALEAMIAAFKAHAAEEANELLSAAKGGQTDEDDELDAQGRALVAMGRGHLSRAVLRGIAMARSGRVLSASNEKLLEKAAGHHKRALRHQRAVAAHHKDMGEHLDKMREAHQRAVSTLQELGYDQDRVNRAMGTISDRIEELGDTAEDGAEANEAVGRSVKAAHQNVRSVIDGSKPKDDEDDPEEVGSGTPDPNAEEERAARERLARAHALRCRVS